MPQKPPADLVTVAAVGRVREEPLLQVGAQQLEKLLLERDPEVRQFPSLQFRDHGVPLLRIALGEGSAVMLTCTRSSAASPSR